jgi:hypothetical protein
MSTVGYGVARVGGSWAGSLEIAGFSAVGMVVTAAP